MGSSHFKMGLPSNEWDTSDSSEPTEIYSILQALDSNSNLNSIFQISSHSSNRSTLKNHFPHPKPEVGPNTMCGDMSLGSILATTTLQPATVKQHIIHR